MFTGSGMPMRFADLNGSMIDVYQAATQMTDESGQTEPLNINSLLDKALGPEGYYGVFTANMHTDNASHPGSDAIVASAQSRGVPIVSASQMLQWLDGRNGSSFNSLSWSGNKLDFTIDVGAGANGLRGMVPTTSAVGALTDVKRNGTSIPTTTQTIKGVHYAFFDAAAGSYEATYAVDDAAPLISNLAQVVQANGNATVTWDTNEPSDSRVDYGTNPSSLASSQSSSAPVSSHSVQLNGLDPNTTYYYRVTSSDAAANSSTEPPGAQSPRSFTTPSTNLTDTTAADFGAGSPGADTYVAETGNGEVTLRPTVGAEFSGGPALPSDWQSQPWNPPAGSATVAGGKLVVDGSAAGTVQTYGPGRSLEFGATFGGASFQHVGFGVDFNNDPDWAMFSIKGDGTFNARTNNGASSTETQLSSSLIGSPHRYRIEWASTEVRYFVDGNLVATHAVNFGATQMRPLASDLNSGGLDVSVDWLHLSPYPAAGTFNSRIFDAGQQVDWGPLGWTADAPSGTGVGISVRIGNTPTPDGSWSSFTPIATSGGDISGNSRYVQYRAQLSTAGPDSTPSLSEVTVGYTVAADTTAPTIVQRSPASNATGVAATSDVAVQFSEPMDPSTINSSSLRLRAQGAGSDIPATVSYSGATATLNPDADLAPGTLYQVTVAGSVKDANGNALGADDTWTFRTQAASLADTTTTDFSAGSPGADTYVSETGNGEVTLRPTVGAEFSGGPLLPLGWSSATWESQGGGAGGSATLAGGALHVNGAYASTDQSFGPGHTLEFVATFNGATFQHAGLSDNFQSAFAIFSTKDSTNQVFARSNFGGGSTDTPVGSLVGAPHRYRVEWDTNQVRYFVDGNLVATHSGTFTTALRVAASDFNSGGPELSVDWARMSPYPASGTFDSRILDAGQPVDWDALSWTADTPAGTGIALSVRTGNTPTPDGSWSSFNPVGSSGGSIAGTSRYLQYRAQLSSSDQGKTPTLSDVTVSYAASGDTTAPDTQIDSGPTGTSSNSSPSFGFSADEPGSSFECRLDSAQAADWAACSSPKSYTNLPDGNHSFEVRATDGAGNTDPTPASRSFTIDSGAPDTQIDSGPTGTSSNPSPSFGFSADEPGSSFECRLDSAQAADWAACSSPKSYTNLPDGNHSFEVRATDGAGNTDPTPASRSFTIDSGAPDTQIDSGPTGTSSNPSPSFGFSADEPGSSFECRLDSAQAADWAACSSPKSYTNLPDGNHSFEVRATDGAGNTDPTPASRSFTIDSGAPDTQIDSGPTGTSSNPSPSFGFSADEPGSSFECRLDSAQAADWAACSSPKSYTNLPDGNHSFEVRATDGAGNTDPTPASRSFTIDSGAPDTQIDSGPTGTSSNSSPSFGFSADEPGSSFECRLDSAQAADWAACSSPKAYTNLPDGNHSFEVRATDAAGNTDPTPASRSFTIDSGAPDTQIDSGPTGTTSNSSPSFGFSADEPGSSFECRLDSAQAADWAACSSPKSYTNLPDGNHSFEVRATDAAGNTDPTPASRSFTIDSGAPDTQIDSGPTGTSSNSSPSFGFSADEPGSSFECRLDSASGRRLGRLLDPPRPTPTWPTATTASRSERPIGAGNTDPTPASRSFTIDSGAPDTQIDSGPTGTTSNSSPSFGFSADEPGSSFECRLDSAQAADWAACSTPKAYTNLADGNHSFEVRATDGGRKHRPDPGLPQLHDRLRRPRHPDRLRAHRDDLQLEPQLRLLGR